MNKQRTIYFVCLATLLIAGCVPGQRAHDIALHRFGDADATVLLVSLPDHLWIESHDSTLAGRQEINIESRRVPIDLRDIAADWPQRLAASLTAWRNPRFVAASTAEQWVERFADDPRRVGQANYRLLEPYRPPPARRDPFAPRPASEGDLNDPCAEKALVRATIRVDNLPRPLWYALEPERLAAHFGADQLLLISVESIHVRQESARSDVTFQIGAHLLELHHPLLALSVADPFSGTGPNGPQAENWGTVKESLDKVVTGYADVLARHLGWLGDPKSDS
ncbi:MAG: hypothetical protein P9L99_12265 [Candidatus Lernaella stagnicola]|nr:hypothetical protein [Candidatus Lernaella stagnicola]